MTGFDRGRVVRWIAVLVMVVASRAGVAPAEVAVLEDTVDVQLIGRELHAFLGSGGALRRRLEMDEKVEWIGSRGNIGAVLTNRRLLAVSSNTGGWQDERRRLGETPETSLLVSGRVALWVTNQRALGFDSSQGLWFEEIIGPHERPVEVRVSQGVAVLVTVRRGLALSPGGGFREVKLRLGESLEQVTALADVATLRTSQRVLVYRAPSGSWGEELIPIN